MVRETGYYWIKFAANSDWETAHFNSEDKEWNVLELMLPATEGELFEINETRILPPNATN